MDVIKMEHEIEPLAINRNDGSDFEEEKPSSEDVDLLKLQLTEIKTECKDNTHDVLSEIKVEEVGVLTTSPVVKCEAEIALCDFDTVKDELKLEPKAEENEILTDRHK
ncbi:uncharacterized protein [Periplaneta americana]|uniref:uncharacterized protein isoform X2 n=1 Tax=Periplaneta americana TaxID=6978 RepID=UPI0037E79008